MDIDGGRRDGTFAELCEFLKLIQGINVIHQEGGGPFEPMDLPAATRHLDLYLAQITYLDKSWQTQTLGHARTMDGIEMAAIMFGCAPEDLPVSLLGIINTNSPLQLDVPMAEGLIAMAAHGQVNVITPFTLAGAMAPVSIAGALVLQHAEAMAGICLTQIVKKGVPVMYGGFTSNVDMRSGSASLGPVGAADLGAVSIQQCHSGQCGRCTGGIRKPDGAVGGYHRRRASDRTRSRLDARRADGQLRKADPRCRNAANDAGLDGTLGHR
jgi:trimethylamine--corrinoid protein Co-methyltransferase